MINYSIYIASANPGTKKEDITHTKAYGTAQVGEKLTFDDFCEHIAAHNTPFSEGAIKGIITDAVNCLREQMLNGNSVELGPLGSFRVELACEGARTTDEFNASNIKEVNVNWSPGKKFKNLRADATFQLVASRKAQDDAIEIVKNEDTIQGLE